MAYTKQLAYEALRSIDSATFTGSYQLLGTALTHPGAIVKLLNNSSKDVTISIDGVNDVDFAPANSFWLYDCVTNRASSVDAVFHPQGRQFFVKGSAGLGSVYLVVQYIVQV
jgi:hypothetical protein